ncbi:MAG: hypothetical protein P4L53_04050 [Candidatus Obscuribacterales bacterium]|nr:hypothetical protein [Candidatus Obscuribacterales bacterium]
MKTASQSNNLILLTLLAVGYFAVRLPWLFSLPIMEAPDEANHLWVTQFLAEHWRAASSSEISQAGSIAVYGPLSPFGYLPNALFSCNFLNTENFRLASRLGTLFAGLPTVFIALVLGRTIFAGSAFMALMLPLLVIVHPQLIFTQSYTNTDALVTSLSSLAILLSVELINKPASLWKSVLIGFVLALAALTKSNSLCLLPAIAFAIWSACQVQALPTSYFLKLFATFGLTLAASSGWFFTRNYLEFGGDFLGSKTMYKIWEPSLEHKDGKAIMPWPAVTKLAWWRFVFFDFWGLFGFMNRYLWRPFYFVFLALCATAGIGNCLTVKNAKTDLTEMEHKKETAIWRFLAICAALNFLAVFYVTASGLSGPHGRYLFPTELPLLALILRGFSGLGDKRQKYCTLLLLVTCVLASGTGFSANYLGHSWRQ